MKKKLEKLNKRIAKLIDKVGPLRKVKDTKKNLKLKKELKSLFIKFEKLADKDFRNEINKFLYKSGESQ